MKKKKVLQGKFTTNEEEEEGVTGCSSNYVATRTPGSKGTNSFAGTPMGATKNKGRSAPTPKGCERVASGEKGSHPERPHLEKPSTRSRVSPPRQEQNTHPHAPGAMQDFRAHRRQ
jgi:hypothetical protein